MDAPAAPPSEPPLLLVVGPTASGKTDLALAIARQIPTEVVVADSRQVYRGMDIGTAKPGPAARRVVRHHLIDLVDPDRSFSVADWVAAARSVIPGIAGRGNLPLVVGGTGLYLSALVEGYDLASLPPSPQLRAALHQMLASDGVVALDARLAVLDPEASQRIDRANPRRLIRAIERVGTQARPNRPWAGPVMRIGLRRPRAVLDERINQRATALFAGGLLVEVATLLGSGFGSDLPPMTGHGYAEAARVLAGEWSLDRAVAITAQRTRQYARRQETWLRRDPAIRWLELGRAEADEPVIVERALALADELRSTAG